MQAAESSNAEIVELLLLSGADVKKKGIDNFNCLHIAVDVALDETCQNDGIQGEEPTEIVELLLSNGAEIFAKNDQGKTPLDLARDYNAAKIIRLLEKYI